MRLRWSIISPAYFTCSWITWKQLDNLCWTIWLCFWILLKCNCSAGRKANLQLFCPMAHRGSSNQWISSLNGYTSWASKRYVQNSFGSWVDKWNSHFCLFFEFISFFPSHCCLFLSLLNHVGSIQLFNHYYPFFCFIHTFLMMIFYNIELITKNFNFNITYIETTFIYIFYL